MSTLLRPCPAPDCGELTDAAYCPEHTAPPVNRQSPLERGYDWRWRKLSERARREQPFCTVCGTDQDLTTDHSPEAWQRKERGLPIRFQDIQVLCRSHNSAKGAAR